MMMRFGARHFLNDVTKANSAVRLFRNHFLNDFKCEMTTF